MGRCLSGGREPPPRRVQDCLPSAGGMRICSPVPEGDVEVAPAAILRFDPREGRKHWSDPVVTGPP